MTLTLHTETRTCRNCGSVHSTFSPRLTRTGPDGLPTLLRSAIPPNTPIAHVDHSTTCQACPSCWPTTPTHTPAQLELFPHTTPLAPQYPRPGYLHRWREEAQRSEPTARTQGHPARTASKPAPLSTADILAGM